MRLVAEEFWPRLRKVAARIPFTQDLVAAYYCVMDPETPMRVRAILLGALAYFIMPFDAVPDFLAVVGFADDGAVLMAALSAVAAHIKPVHRRAAAEALSDPDMPVAG
nr:YkvA family protein [Lutibaculum baratangense]